MKRKNKYIITLIAGLIISFAEAKNDEMPSSIEFTDQVHHLEDEGDKFMVSFQVHAAIYHLEKTRSDFLKQKKLLEQRKAKKRPVTVKVDPQEMVILSVK